MRRSAPLRRRTPLRVAARRGRVRYTAAQVVAYERAGGWCEIRVRGVCEGRGQQTHHRLPRSAGGPDTPDNLLVSCAACHRHTHSHPAESYERGTLLRRLA